MFGNNPRRAPVKGDGTKIDVQNIFKTIQGEGPYSGRPAIFIRLGGCNLACKFCDTEFETYQNESLAEIIEKVESLNPDHAINLIVITGGEPLRQPIELLCNKLIAQKYLVQIETNGTLYQSLPKEVKIICSPKPSDSGYYPIRDDLLQRVNALKFVISDHIDLYRDISEVGQSKYNIPVYLQPMDEIDAAKNADNLKRTLELLAKGDYHLSLQVHKIVGLP